MIREAWVLLVDSAKQRHGDERDVNLLDQGENSVLGDVDELRPQSYSVKQNLRVDSRPRGEVCGYGEISAHNLDEVGHDYNRAGAGQALPHHLHRLHRHRHCRRPCRCPPCHRHVDVN